MKNTEENQIVWKIAKVFGISGQSDGLYEALSRAHKVAPTEIPVLIIGANGTGKEKIAEIIHSYSKAGLDFKKNMLSLNCAAIAPNIFESEMFGHEKGAFTGANNMKKGAFELAHGSTLFLDELGEMPMEQQAKLLRVMQSGTCRRMGSNSAKDDVEARPRIIAATNINVTEALRKGTLREDLFYRFAYRIEIPPLSARPEDIPILADSFLQLFIKKYKKPGETYPKNISPRALKCLERHSWPGNIRELMSIIENAFINARGSSITEADLSIFARPEQESGDGIVEPYDGFDSKGYLDSVRDQLYRRALEMNGDNVSAAARYLKITKQSLSQWKDKQA